MATEGSGNAIAPSSYSFENISEMYSSTPVVLENSEDSPPPAVEEAAVEAAAEEEKEEAPEAEAEEEGEEEEATEAEEEKKAEEPEKKVRIFKAKVGESEVEIPEDAEFEIKVDGKMVKAKFADLQKHYSGTVSIEKKYETFKKEQDSLKTAQQQLDIEKESLNGVLNSVFEFGKQRDPVKFIQKIVEFSDMDPAEFEVNLLDSLTPIVQNWAALSPEEKNLLVLQRKSKIQSEKLSKYEQEKQTTTAQREMEQKLVQLCQTENISEQEFVDNFNELARLKEGGHLQIAKIEPQHVVEYTKVRQAQSRVNLALEKVDASLIENRDVVSFLISEVRKEPDMSEADLDEIVQGAFGKGKKAKVEDRLNKKLNDSDAVVTSKKTSSATGPKQERVAGHSLAVTTPWTFNDGF